jgi:anaerobic ribonucleoside-triphosphate reductase activating protein
MRLSGITAESLVDGPGIRYVIFTQGCRHQCPQCQNPETWDMNAGKEFTVKQIIRMIKKQIKLLTNTKIQGVTFSGGEPFLQAGELAEVALAVHEIGWDVVSYSGYTFEEITNLAETDDEVFALINECDILIDGRYIHEMRDIGLTFCGSSNQRVIDMEKTRKKNKIVLWKNK